MNCVIEIELLWRCVTCEHVIPLVRKDEEAPDCEVCGKTMLYTISFIDAEELKR